MPSEANFWWLYYIVAHDTAYFNIFCGHYNSIAGAGSSAAAGGVGREGLCPSGSQYHPHFLFLEKKTAVEPSKEKRLWVVTCRP